MKQKIRKLFGIIFGTNTSILFCVSLSSLVTGIIFLIFSTIVFQNNHDSGRVFMCASSAFFSVWISTTQDSDTFTKFVAEFVRLAIFFLVFIFSTYNCLIFCLDYNNQPVIMICISFVGIFLCVCYFICKLTSIFHFIQKILNQIKIKIFGSNNYTPTKTKTLIENVTAFLISVGGLTIAVKTIVESIFQLFGYFVR